MVFTIVPTIWQGQIVNVSLSFDKPLSFAEFRKLVKRLETKSRQHKKRIPKYIPVCIKEPIYSNGEIIAILEKYPDGTSKRTYV